MGINWFQVKGAHAVYNSNRPKKGLYFIRLTNSHKYQNREVDCSIVICTINISVV